MLRKNALFTGSIVAVFVSLLFVVSRFAGFDAAAPETDILFKLRGSRPISDRIAFIFIDSRDVQELGGWPITRDYYGYLTYILKQAGAKVVAIDVLFDAENSRYPEYDADLSQFLRQSKNVCLPFSFSDLSDSFKSSTISAMLGTHSNLPIDSFRRHAAGLGFSNLPQDETVLRHAILAASDGDTLYPSFGLECARLFLLGPDSKTLYAANSIILKNDSTSIRIKTEDYFKIRLNHFEPSRLNSMSLIDLFQTFQNDPDQLDLHNKLVFVGVTAPGAAPMVMSPSQPSFPASLAHLTVAENLINSNYVRTASAWLTILFIFAGGLFTALFSISSWKKVLVVVAAFLLYVAAAVLIFKFTAFALPLFFPILTFFIASTSMFAIQFQHKSSLQKLYADEIETKQQQLAKAQEQFQQLAQETHQLRDEKEKEILRLEKELRDLKTTESPEPQVMRTFEKIIHAENSPLVQVLQLVEKIASDDIPVLISGETGTGKEVISHAIHESGKRSKKQFIAVNCGALPETLLESELFGHEKGAFTGATSQRKGRFELADGGTLFLDEITETTAAFQAKLLRVLQEGTFERLGSEKTLKVDVRIIAASSKNIPQQVEQGVFREDLFYRLNGIQIELPALRERQEDIPLLARYFLAKHGYENITAFSDRALEVMKFYRWAGNVRELENTIRRAALLAQSDGRRMIQEIDLPDALRDKAREELQINFHTLDEQILATLRSLKFSHSSISQTAQALGNKDRGTITEYFRGLCFEFFVQANFNADAAAAALAATDDDAVIEKVKSKLIEYIGKVKSNPAATSLYKGLPKKYHDYLDAIVKHTASDGLDA